MNEERRKKLESVLTKLDDAKSALEEVKSDEQDAYDALVQLHPPRYSGRTFVELCLDSLDEAINKLDSAISDIQTATGG